MQPSQQEMSNGEIARRLEDIVREFQAFAQKTLLREVYDAHQLLYDARLVRLEEQRKDEAEERASTRRLLFGSILTFAGSTFAQIIAIILVHR